MSKRMNRAFLLAIVGVAGAASTGLGVTVDLSTTSSGTINNALFQQFNVSPAGTGVIDSFLRVQSPGNTTTEQGYNTSGRPAPFDDLTDPNFTRNLQLSDLQTQVVNGTTYYTFLLDTNEPNGGGQNLVTLDQLQVFTSPTGSQTTTNV